MVRHVYIPIKLAARPAPAEGEPEKEWVALATDSARRHFSLCEWSTVYNPDCSYRMARNPVTQAPMSDDMIMKGRDLLALLNGVAQT